MAHTSGTVGLYVGIVFLFVPMVILWAVVRRHWHVLTGAAGTILVMCSASFIVLPSWLGDFVTEVERYPSYAPVGSPVWIITRYFFPWLGAPVEVALTAALIMWMLVMWRRLWRDKSWPVFVWVTGVTLVVTNLVVTRTATTNYLVLLVPLAQVMAAIQTRWKRAGAWMVLSIEVVLLAGLWPLFLATIVNKTEQPIMFLPLPVIVAVAVAAWPKLSVWHSNNNVVRGAGWKQQGRA